MGNGFQNQKTLCLGTDQSLPPSPGLYPAAFTETSFSPTLTAFCQAPAALRLQVTAEVPPGLPGPEPPSDLLPLLPEPEPGALPDLPPLLSEPEPGALSDLPPLLPGMEPGAQSDLLTALLEPEFLSGLPASPEPELLSDPGPLLPDPGSVAPSGLLPPRGPESPGLPLPGLAVYP